MKISKLFHWLYATLMFLPVLVLPAFMVYSHRHTIDSYQVNYAQNEIVDFNQIVNEDLYLYNIGVTISFSNEKVHFDGLCTETAFFGAQISEISSKQNHKYYLRSNDYDVNFIPRFTLGLWSNGWVDTSNVNDILISSVDNGYFSIIINSIAETDYDSSCYLQLFDLTQMFGSGNEPTIEQFNVWYPNNYYEYTLSHKELLNVGSITYNDTDIGSQFMYCLYNSVDKYFNFNNVFNFNQIYDWFVLNIFNGNAPLIAPVVWNIILYEFIMDLMFLLYGLFMFFIDLCKRLIEKPINSIK